MAKAESCQSHKGEEAEKTGQSPGVIFKASLPFRQFAVKLVCIRDDVSSGQILICHSRHKTLMHPTSEMFDVN